jgi:hypothetical protein
MCQSLLEDRPVRWELAVKDAPQEHRNYLDYIIDMIDWEANLDPDFKENLVVLKQFGQGNPNAGEVD